ncbi:hypothetical protein P168DRAFT_282336 [Aspergillus campestris IBT 28561]|uniref:Uncharacterized protein n=1 Tax=Aspergillus campestris (strain IBT 28561) TaxID=1392248 RepID=A0A2I1D165_ASPC2|nr:uncharacterized protein P168DRAFT_282336 [Aspergillus campestris IBT 28561]PKY03611.1 hypothetical protein P168DRAFT_282336 [Aspergillus campestris IBT 28561]
MNDSPELESSTVPGSQYDLGSVVHLPPPIVKPKTGVLPGANNPKNKKKKTSDPQWDSKDTSSDDASSAEFFFKRHGPQKKRKLGSDDEDTPRSKLKKKKRADPTFVIDHAENMDDDDYDEARHDEKGTAISALGNFLRGAQASPTPKKRKPSYNRAAGAQGSDEEDAPTNDFRISKNETADMVFDFSLERSKRLADAISLPGNLYTQVERDLFGRLAMRGFEPILSSQWKFDFQTLPESLFPAAGEDFEPLVQALGGSEFYASKSMNDLFSLGGRVRDCSILKKRPELLIEKEIKRYIRWAVFDAHLLFNRDSIPVYAIHPHKVGDSIINGVKRLDKRLKALAARHSDESSAISYSGDDSPLYPVFTGFLICGPILTIMTYSADPQDRTETTDSNFISQFDLGEWGQDVWNSLALVITVMHIRRTMLQLVERGLGGIYRAEGYMVSDTDEDL